MLWFDSEKVYRFLFPLRTLIILYFYLQTKKTAELEVIIKFNHLVIVKLSSVLKKNGKFEAMDDVLKTADSNYIVMTEYQKWNKNTSPFQLFKYSTECA